MNTWPKGGIAAELIRYRLSHSGSTLINGENNHHISMLSFTTELSRRYISVQVCSLHKYFIERKGNFKICKT